MRLIGREKIQNFTIRHPDARLGLQAWAAEAATAIWKTPQDIKNRYRTASFLHDNLVVFNIKGNSYRLAAHINYGLGVVLVRMIGTHAEYNNWDL